MAVMVCYPGSIVSKDLHLRWESNELGMIISLQPPDGDLVWTVTLLVGSRIVITRQFGSRYTVLCKA